MLLCVKDPMYLLSWVGVLIILSSMVLNLKKRTFVNKFSEVKCLSGYSKTCIWIYTILEFQHVVCLV